MELLKDINLPGFTSTQFANKKSKDVWEDKIRRGSRFYPQIEYQTVKHGVRKCMIAHNIDPYIMDGYSKQLFKDGLIIVPLAKEASGGGSGFGHSSQGFDGNGRYTYRCVIGRNLNDINEFIEAHHARDDVKIGELLGFPVCCSRFFDDIWQAGYFDPIWQQAINTPSDLIKKRTTFDGEITKEFIRIKDNGEAYKTLSVFRYIGIRVLSHMPCSFHCEESIKVANQWIDLGRNLGLDGVEETLEIMGLPFEWDCLKGVAIVNTPVFKIATQSVPCFPRHVIQKESSFYPEEAPNGLAFPWKYKGEKQ